MDKKLEFLVESIISPILSDYYRDLDHALKQHGMELNYNHSDIYNNPSDVFIFRNGERVGKINVDIKNNILYKNHISSRNDDGDLIQGLGLLSIIYPFDKKFALDHNLSVQGSFINPITKKKFLEIYKDWSIKNLRAGILLAINPSLNAAT